MVEYFKPVQTIFKIENSNSIIWNIVKSYGSRQKSIFVFQKGLSSLNNFLNINP